MGTETLSRLFLAEQLDRDRDSVWCTLCTLLCPCIGRTGLARTRGYATSASLARVCVMRCAADRVCNPTNRFGWTTGSITYLFGSPFIWQVSYFDFHHNLYLGTLLGIQLGTYLQGFMRGDGHSSSILMATSILSSAVSNLSTPVSAQWTYVNNKNWLSCGFPSPSSILLSQHQKVL